MANDPTHDPNCVALYRFESGALTIDSRGSNTLTNNNNVAEDTVNYMEGICSAFFTRSSAQYFSCLDNDLDAGFPMKNGDTNKKISICCRYRPTNAGNLEGLVAKSDTNKITFYLYKGSANTIGFRIGYNNGESVETKSHASTLTCDGSKKYFIAVTFDNSDKSFRIHIYDLTTGQILGTDVTGNYTNNINVEDAVFIIGVISGISSYTDGNIDEVIIFNDILTIAEIEKIRAQTYVYPEFITVNSLSLLYDIADEDSTVSCDNETSDFPIDYALEYDRPFKRLLAQDTTETTIELGYQSSIDTIFLGNCNFEDFKIEISSIQIDFSTVIDKDSGYYNALIRLGSAITSFKIIIPSQSTVNGESFFAIGAIVAGVRSDLTAKPQYALRKKLIEPTFAMRFDGQNREVQEIGRSYHLLDFNWNGINSDNYEEIEDIIREMGQAGIGVVYEKWSDYEASYLCQLQGNFQHTRIKDFYKHPLKFRELV